MHQGRIGPVASFEVVSRPLVIAFFAEHGPHERDRIHLLGQLSEPFGQANGFGFGGPVTGPGGNARAGVRIKRLPVQPQDDDRPRRLGPWHPFGFAAEQPPEGAEPSESAQAGGTKKRPPVPMGRMAARAVMGDQWFHANSVVLINAQLRSSSNWARRGPLLPDNCCKK